MNTYKHINDLYTTFINNNFKFEDFVVNDMKYLGPTHRDISWSSIVGKPNIVLTTFTICPQYIRQYIEQHGKDVVHNQYKIIFGWTYNNLNQLIPLGVMYTTANRISNNISESIEISPHETIVIDGINGNQPIKAKIDTGADMCCLHATNIVANNNIVTFVSFGKKYQMNVVDMQHIKQADSDESTARPVVSLNVKIADKYVTNIQFNLNDRSNMDCHVLIGKNLLSKHDFAIQTQQSVTEDWEYYDQLVMTFLKEHEL